MVFLRALFVFKHQPFTVQSNFLMPLLLMAITHFHSLEMTFQRVSPCAVSSPVCRPVALPVHPPLALPSPGPTERAGAE